MNERIKYPIVMTIICVISAAALALSYSLTKDRIAGSKASEFNKGLQVVLPKEARAIERRTLPGLTSEHPKDDELVYVARENADQTGKVLGYAAVGKAQGYSSKIEVMVGLDPAMRIIAIRILAQQETPGLGEQTKDVPPTKTIWQAIGGLFGGGTPEEEREPPFQAQFRTRTLNQLELTKEQGSKDGITQLTGATITSRAVVDAVKDATAKIEAATVKDTGEGGTKQTGEE